MSAGRIQLEALGIALGDGASAFTAVRDVNAVIEPGEFVCILGPSGCGKSTLLAALAGHVAPNAGRATLDGKLIEGPHPERGMVFQQHTLLPWRKTLDNVAFAERYPAQLSGGMQQRAEIARAILNEPRVLLMDEPFGALDAQTRASMQALLLDVWSERRPTVVFVTHDIDEALFLADRVLVMSHSPGTVLEELRVPFARPRERELVTEAGFVALKRRCLALLRYPLASPMAASNDAPARIDISHSVLS